MKKKTYRVYLQRTVVALEEQWVDVEAASEVGARRAALAEARNDDEFWMCAKEYCDGQRGRTRVESMKEVQHSTGAQFGPDDDKCTLFERGLAALDASAAAKRSAP